MKKFFIGLAIALGLGVVFLIGAILHYLVQPGPRY